MLHPVRPEWFGLKTSVDHPDLAYFGPQCMGIVIQEASGIDRMQGKAGRREHAFGFVIMRGSVEWR